MKLLKPRYSLISLLINIVSRKYFKLSYFWIPIISFFFILIIYFLTLKDDDKLNSTPIIIEQIKNEQNLPITEQLIKEIIFITPSQTPTVDNDNNNIIIVDKTSTTTTTPTTEEISTTISNKNEVTNPPEIDYELPLRYYCYSTRAKLIENIDYLENIQTATIQPKNGQNIFFHETTCIENGLVKLTARQACSIESAAKTNPKMMIFVLFAAMVGFQHNTTKDPIISALEKYPNIHFRHVDIWSYASGTIPEAQQFMNTGILFQSSYLNVHIADFLRILSLFRYGGSHFDLDFIVKKDLSEILPNYLGEELPNEINNGFMNFAKDGIGHHVIQECLLEFSTTYKKDKWGDNGPILLTRMIKRLCKVERVTVCPWFRVFDSKAFCPIYYGKLELLFDTNFLEEAMEVTKDAIGIHCWNALTSDTKVKVGTNVGYGKFAEEYCPNVYGSCGEYF